VKDRNTHSGFGRSLLPADAAESVDGVGYENESPVVIQAFQTSS